MSIQLPTTFSQDAPLLHSMLADHGYAARMVWITVKDAPLWHEGDIVARVTGRYPAAYPSLSWEFPVVLLDNGVISVIASFNIDREEE